MAFGGIALKSVSLFLRFIEFCCAAIITGFFGYFLSVLADHHLHIPTYEYAVIVIAAAGVVYTVAAMVLVCCLGGIAFFAVIGMILDFCFTGAFAYLAYATRHGDSCSGNFLRTPVGDGLRNSRVQDGNGGITHLVKLSTACRFNTACFAVAIIGAFFFFFSLFVEFGLMKHHKKEKAFGPGPNNGYTAGTPKRRFWQRKPKNQTRDAEFAAGGLAAEKHHPDSLPAHTTPGAVRNSYQTDTTAVGNEPAFNKYGPTHTPATNGYQTTTTTHTPHAVGGTNELPADGYQRTHQPYNGNPTATY